MEGGGRKAKAYVCVLGGGGGGLLEGRGAMEEGGEGKGLVVVVALSTLYLLAPLSHSPLPPTPTQRHLAKNDSLIQKAAFLKAVFQRLREKRERS